MLKKRALKVGPAGLLLQGLHLCVAWDRCLKDLSREKGHGCHCQVTANIKTFWNTSLIDSSHQKKDQNVVEFEDDLFHLKLS